MALQCLAKNGSGCERDATCIMALPSGRASFPSCSWCASAWTTDPTDPRCMLRRCLARTNQRTTRAIRKARPLHWRNAAGKGFIRPYRK